MTLFIRSEEAVRHWDEYYNDKLYRNYNRELIFARSLGGFLKNKGCKILDIACGHGEFLKILEMFSINAFGIDVNISKYRLVKNLYKKNIAEGNALQLCFKNNSINAVTAIGFIEHLSIDEFSNTFIPSVKEILTDPNIILFHVPVKTPLTIFSRFVRKYIMRDLKEGSIDDDNDLTHKIWLTPNEYTTLFEKNGIQILLKDFYLYRSSRRPRILSFFRTFASYF